VTFFGPLGDLGALGVMRSLDTSTASHAKNARGAKEDRFTVASHLVCDVHVRHRPMPGETGM
jgi:hypothetical protein